MPIRFRCQHCNQLMGIARRKSGTEVRCPTCQEMVLVPKVDEDSPDPDAPEAQTAGAKAAVEAPVPKVGQFPIFERSDFDEVLRGTEDAGKARSVRPPSPRVERNLAAAAGRVPNYDVEPVPVKPPMSQPSLPAANGIFVSSTRLTVCAVVVIVLLAVAFGAGLLVGRYCL